MATHSEPFARDLAASSAPSWVNWVSYGPTCLWRTGQPSTWESLVAVCDAAGGAWPTRIRAACVALVNAGDADATSASLGVKLLSDIAAIFDEERIDFMTSKALVERLHAIPEAPWADFNTSMNALAWRLRPFGVTPRPDATRKVRGYFLADFRDAFSRYVPSGPSEVSNSPNDLQEGAER